MTPRPTGPKRMAPYEAWNIVGADGLSRRAAYNSRADAQRDKRIIQRLWGFMRLRIARVLVTEVPPKRRPKP